MTSAAMIEPSASFVVLRSGTEVAVLVRCGNTQKASTHKPFNRDCRVPLNRLPLERVALIFDDRNGYVQQD
jgi:hypothetical protein